MNLFAKFSMSFIFTAGVSFTAAQASDLKCEYVGGHYSEFSGPKPSDHGYEVNSFILAVTTAGPSHVVMKYLSNDHVFLLGTASNEASGRYSLSQMAPAGVSHWTGQWLQISENLTSPMIGSCGIVVWGAWSSAHDFKCCYGASPSGGKSSGAGTSSGTAPATIDRCEDHVINPEFCS